MSVKKKAIFALLPFMAAGLATATIGLSTSPMMVEAADGEKVKLPSMGWTGNAQGIPAIGADGTIQFGYLADFVNTHNYDDADLAFRFDVYDTGTTEIVNTLPDVSEMEHLGSFDFQELNAFASPSVVKEGLRAIYTENPYDVTHALAFEGTLVDLNGTDKYLDSDPVTVLGTYSYDLFEEAPTPGNGFGDANSFYIVCDDPISDGSLHHSYCSDLADDIEPYLELEFAFFSVGSEFVDQPVYTDQPLVASLTKRGEGFVSEQEILAAFEESGVVGSNDYYGCVVRVAPREDVENNFYRASPWLTLRNSHQYKVSNAFGKNVYASSSDGAYVLSNVNDGDSGSRWAAGPDFAAKPTYLLLDLGKSYDLTSLVISWENAYATEYNIYIGNGYIDFDNLFAEGFLEKGGWTAADVTELSFNQENGPTIGSDIDTEYLTEGTEATGRYVVVEMLKPRPENWAYSIFEISAYGTESEFSSAYYTIKNVLDTTGCADFSNDPAKAEEFHAMLADLMGQLTEEDKAALGSVTPTYEYDESEDKTAYPQNYMVLADYLLAKSEFYSSKTDSPAAFVEKGESLNVALGVGALVISAAAAGAFFLLKKKKAN